MTGRINYPGRKAIVNSRSREKLNRQRETREAIDREQRSSMTKTKSARAESEGTLTSE